MSNIPVGERFKIQLVMIIISFFCGPVCYTHVFKEVFCHFGILPFFTNFLNNGVLQFGEHLLLLTGRYEDVLRSGIDVNMSHQTLYWYKVKALL